MDDRQTYVNEYVSDMLELMRTSPEFQARVKARIEREKEKLRPARRKGRAKYEANPRNKVKVNARHAVLNALKSGKLMPSDCAMQNAAGITCDGPIEAHHANGYDKEHRLDVVWLCRHHHRLLDTGVLKVN